MLSTMLTLLLAAAASTPATITGIPTITDGDTLQIRTTKIRLYGIDAPESAQTCLRDGAKYRCGRDAAFALADLVAGRNITCTRKSTDRYGRMVALCTLGDVEVNRWLVEHGHALAYLAYGGARYRAAEESARAARLGVWGGEFTVPWVWRKGSGSTVYTNCAQVRAVGAAPLRIGQTGYSTALDRDRDGVACD